MRSLTVVLDIEKVIGGSTFPLADRAIDHGAAQLDLLGRNGRLWPLRRKLGLGLGLGRHDCCNASVSRSRLSLVA